MAELNRAKPDGLIYMTSDYSIFKLLDGNRDVTSQRAKKIRSSIQKNGYILSPIAINEKYEIIDGQGRLEALRQLGLPVHFYFVPNAGLKECAALNAYSTTWTFKDYVKSYADMGNESYKRLQALLEEFGYEIGIKAIYFATKGICLQHDSIKLGKLSVTAEEFLHAENLLTKLLHFTPLIRQINGRREVLQIALTFALGLDDVKEEQLLRAIQRNQLIFPTYVNTKTALEVLEAMYNRGKKVGHVYLVDAYDRYMRGKYNWYGKRYGNDEESVC